MKTRRRRGLQPQVERLETQCLLSAGVIAPAQVHAAALQGQVHMLARPTNLKRTQVGLDIASAILNSTPSTGRQSLKLNNLTATAQGQINGKATAIYNFRGIKVTVTVNINTKFENPKPRGITYTASALSSTILTRANTSRVTQSIIATIKQDAALIRSLV